MLTIKDIKKAKLSKEVKNYIIDMYFEEDFKVEFESFEDLRLSIISEFNAFIADQYINPHNYIGDLNDLMSEVKLTRKVLNELSK